MLPKVCLSISCLLLQLGGLTNADLTDVHQKYQELDYNVGYEMIIENFLGVTLKYHTSEVISGQHPDSGYPTAIGAGLVDGFVGHKTGHTARGCAGTVSYKIGNTNKILTVMYSVPYSQDFHSNWLGLWVHEAADIEAGDESVFNRMYYNDDGPWVRQEYYYELPTLNLNAAAGITVKGQMGSSHKTSIRITLAPSNPRSRPANGK